LREGISTDLELAKLLKETGADAVYWNRRYEPAVMQRDSALKRKLRDSGVTVESFNSALLFEPHEIQKPSGGPYQVFTPFWKALQQHPLRSPAPTPAKLTGVPQVASLPLDALRLLPRLPWADAFPKVWEPGSSGAWKRAREFLATTQRRYGDERDYPDRDGTSRLSPHLHFGEISTLQLWLESTSIDPDGKGAGHFRREIAWREFSHHLLYHFPKTPEEPLRPAYAAFPWEPDERLLKAWQRGNTGYPIVDAGMRQLWVTGWMHNRVRMIVASFLVKHLLQPWLAGADWFWDTLVDADLAQNTLGWQWTAGCGADAAPYFRIFNPILQGEKFDPDGRYVRQWCPELSKLPVSILHKPWEAGDLVLKGCGVRLGSTYPEPIIDHNVGREKALAALARLGETPLPEARPSTPV
jgi:deoxyribodipyrimidine photo-lyase